MLSGGFTLRKKKIEKDQNMAGAYGEMKMRNWWIVKAIPAFHCAGPCLEPRQCDALAAPLPLPNGTIAGWAYRFFLASGLVATLAACQADVDGLGGRKTSNDVKPPPSTVVTETFGNNGAEITLMLAKAPAGYYEGEARDVRDGAALAVGELGADLVRVKVADISGGAANIQAEATAAKARNSVLLVGYAPSSVTATLAAVPADQRPLLINTGRKVAAPGGTVFNFASDEADSAIEGIRVAASNGRRKFVVFVQSDYPTGYEAGIEAAIRKAGGNLLGAPRYEASSSGAADAAAKTQELLKSADASLILGNTASAAALVSAIKSSGAQPKMTFIGTSAWPEQAFSVPAATGVIVVSVDRENRDLIADRYSRRYGRQLSLAAAYGYNSVALASGIVRSNGTSVLTPELLTRKAGFTGITGLFRLAPSGDVQRKLTPYVINNGKFERLAAPAPVKS